MFFQIYGETAGWQLLGWLLVFAGLVIMNEIARRSKWGGIACFLVLPAVLSVYFIAIYIGAASGAEWALNNDTYVHMNSWFHYAKLYAATAGCIGFMILKYHWGKLGKAHPAQLFPGQPRTAGGHRLCRCGGFSLSDPQIRHPNVLHHC